MAYWAKTYGPGEAKAVAVDRDGDIIVVGEREGDGFVARLDRDGNVKWFKTYGGDKDDVFNDVKIAPNGDIIVAGYTESFGVGGRSVWVLRLDEEGNVKWQKTYGGKYSDGASSVAISSNGDIIVAGYTWSFALVGVIFGFSVWMRMGISNGKKHMVESGMRELRQLLLPQMVT